MIDKASLDSLESLHRLKADGVITQDEFEQSKQRILFGQGKAKPQPTSGSTTLPAFTGELPAEDDHRGWITLPLRRYADFTGRSGRKEFWMFQLISVALAVIGVVFVGGTADMYGEWSPFGNVVAALITLVMLGLFVPTLAVQVRRFHDQDRSGWFVLVNLIPYVGFVIVFVFMLLEGTAGENRFGPDPKQR